MKLEEAIKQPLFNSSLEKALVNIMYTYNWFRDRSQVVYKPYGLRMQHFNVLRIVKGRHPDSISPGEIKEVMLDKSPDLTRLLDKLVKMKLVKRHICPENRRRMDVTITKDGINLVTKLGKEQEKLRGTLASRLTEEEAENLSNLMDKMRG